MWSPNRGGRSVRFDCTFFQMFYLSYRFQFQSQYGTQSIDHHTAILDRGHVLGGMKTWELIGVFLWGTVGKDELEHQTGQFMSSFPASPYCARLLSTDLQDEQNKCK